MAGKSRVNTRDFRGAIDSFEKAVELNPKSAAAHLELGCLYDEKEPDPAAAIYHYERYLKLLPNSGKQEIIKMRILACKQQLAQTVSLGPVTEKQQRELEQLVEETRRLRADLEKWRVYALWLQNLTNQTGGRLPTARVPLAPAPVRPLAASTSSSSPGTVSQTPATGAALSRTHIVKAGENPTVIARKYGVKVDALLAANPGVDPRRLRVGQTLNLPAR